MKKKEHKFTFFGVKQAPAVITDCWGLVYYVVVRSVYLCR